MEFDFYAFADYSGATSVALQRKRIVLAKSDTRTRGEEVERKHLTREELLFEMQQLLLRLTEEGRRVLFGFDHNYSFPMGFYETLTGEEWTSWEQILNLVTGQGQFQPSVLLGAREWAKQVNKLFQQQLPIDTGGPFWGPHFEQATDPRFPFALTSLKERRLVEERCRSMKPIYKVGGAGSVGLQSLYGIAYLAELKLFCKRQSIPLFSWPFDGWEWPRQGHVMVEVYPTLYNGNERTDEEDARACVVWMAEQDRTDRLREWMKINLSKEERLRASLEGWVLGVR